VTVLEWRTINNSNEKSNPIQPFITIQSNTIQTNPIQTDQNKSSGIEAEHRQQGHHQNSAVVAVNEGLIIKTIITKIQSNPIPVQSNSNPIQSQSNPILTPKKLKS